MVSLGGDGSILRAVDLLDGRPVPVLGVNHGELGYLTTFEPAEAQVAVGRALAGDRDLEERMMLHIEVRRPDGSTIAVDHALNEVVVERTSSSQTVRVGVPLGRGVPDLIRGRWADRCHADRLNGLRLLGPGAARRPGSPGYPN
ncbi:MAG: hypothetical protein Ct9H300mP12_00960 [Acidimicrobiales bacterium]|nr:MAG: hypothetical protein Ct9H300mP12_00960 [Acidimicrobiales bacterium]